MKKVKIGVFGARRGAAYFFSLLENNADIVAVCDKDEKYLAKAKEKLGNNTKYFKDFDSFIEEPMDAVFLANYFHEHTEYAIRCLERNIHVLSECTSNATMAEGVALVEPLRSRRRFICSLKTIPLCSSIRK